MEMTTKAIIIIGLLIWLSAGAVVHKLADSCGLAVCACPHHARQLPFAVLRSPWSDTGSVKC